MRKGSNPHKDQILSRTNYLHQIIIPVYVPNEEEYFKESFKILQLCLNSIFKTTHSRTFISVVNNGSGLAVKVYLEELLSQNKIQELIHTENIGKLNAILKGLVGNDIELVTIADADVLFLNGWQTQTIKIFKTIPKAGVVGLTPQFKMYETNCGNIIFDNLFHKNLQFSRVFNQTALINFYDSIGWKKDYNTNYLEYNLSYQVENLKVLVGSGHFVATYKKNIFNEITSFLEYKLGGDSEQYIDKLLLKNDYWRLTTQDNFAYHMGNIYENWMSEIKFEDVNENQMTSDFHKNKKLNFFFYFFKNRIFVKLFSHKGFNRMFLKWKGLPPEMIKNY
ncbi:MAG: glycosyltransferase [Flavobacterium sp.]|nr:glycosyltransferase [Flavobacterium sp.]